MIPLVQFHIKAPLDGTRIGSSLDRADGLFTATFALESEDLFTYRQAKSIRGKSLCRQRTSSTRRLTDSGIFSAVLVRGSSLPCDEVPAATSLHTVAGFYIPYRPGALKL
jgi:hypothetical protein